MEKIIEFAEKYNMLPRGSSVIAAVSGGADSMCLLTFLAENSEKLGISVSAAHFNHLLRGEEADRDESFVRDFCSVRDIPFYVGRGDVAHYAEKNAMGTEEAARLLRYRFLEETRKKAGADVIATAHNGDDNAETVIFNLTRGAGLRGLRGIPPVRGNIVRPVLCLTRDEIEEYLKARGISYVTDSTNLQDIYSRNKIRHGVVPVLKEINPRFSESVMRASENLRKDEACLSGMAEKFIKDNFRNDRVLAEELAALPEAVSSRVIRSVWGNELPSVHIREILKLCAGRSPSGSLDLPGGSVHREYEYLVFGGSTPGKLETVTLNVGETVRLSPLNIEVSIFETVFDNNIHKSFTDYLFKITEVYGKISIRPRLTGDRIRPRGCSYTKTVKKLLAENHVPAGKRDLIPIITDDAGVLAVHKIALGGRASPSPGDMVYKITFKECI